MKRPSKTKAKSRQSSSQKLSIKNRILSNWLIQWPLFTAVAAVIMAFSFYRYVIEPHHANSRAGATLAAVSETVQPRRLHLFNCSEAFEKERRLYGDCIPWRCGRGVVDGLVQPAEAARLLRIAQRGLAMGGGSGGASILELQSGALSMGDKFVNVYKVLRNDATQRQQLFSTEELALYHDVLERIKRALALEFRIPAQRLLLGNPTFFSRITNRSAVTPHDEYWHTHVDKVVYKYFHLTSLLYLADFGTDFHGGRFVFVDEASSSRHVYVEPKQGRLSYFTSGSENTHFVEKVKSGTRFALTIAFTCDSKNGVKKLIIP